MSSLKLAGKNALITGGASGIGAATALRLADEGANVVVVDIDEEGARVVAKEIEGAAFACDVADVSSVRTTVAVAEEEVGPIEILINNAGMDRMAFFLNTNEDTWRRVIDVNLLGTIAFTHAVLPSMHRRHSGVIVNVASEAGRVGTVGGAVYSAAKGGVVAFTKAIARESARYGVRCNAVAPGPIDTNLLNGDAAEAGDKWERIKVAMVASTAMQRLGRPDEVASAITYLASDDATYVTGEILAVSGGLTMV